MQNIYFNEGNLQSFRLKVINKNFNNYLIVTAKIFTQYKYFDNRHNFGTIIKHGNIFYNLSRSQIMVSSSKIHVFNAYLAIVHIINELARQENYSLLTLFWLGFFMYVKWLGGGKFTPCLKSSKKDATKLKFTPQLGNHKTFQKKLKKIVDQIFFDGLSKFLTKFTKKWPN